MVFIIKKEAELKELENSQPVPGCKSLLGREYQGCGLSKHLIRRSGC
jgi:hypothetical protein